MAKAVLVFHLVCAFLAVMIQDATLEQEIGFHLANAGQNITLKCPHDEESTRLFWYKHGLGQKPRLICSFYKYDKTGHFYNEFRTDSRFTSLNNITGNNLTITNLRVSDTATYYCGTSFSFILIFITGTFVRVQNPEPNTKTSIQQAIPETILPGESVTLNCTVHHGTCEKQQSIYWFRHTEENNFGLVQIPETQCDRSLDSQTYTCFYNVPLDSLNQSQPGTYHCAVASCGLILFGNGTRVSLKDILFLYFWSVAAALVTILSAVMSVSAFLMNKRKPCPCQGIRNAKSDNIYYNVVKEIKAKNSQQQRDETWSQCVYLSVTP
uniref:Uncharacterized LOC114480833 n=1 Tax=Gouania willdenowi TaxID=441366 RepID=A0A8C5NCZ1_GOUWI